MNDRLALAGVTKRFGRTIALDGFSLSVRGGELLALVGPSGCGKTTALHVMAGLTASDAGDVRFDDVSWLPVDAAARNVALVFQDGALYPHLTVAGNLAFPLKARRMAAARDAVRAMADRLEIGDLLDRFPDQLSGGERQRVALGRALIRRPNLLLLDEPLTSLDAPLREKLRGLVRDLVHETGVTTIFVTHDQAEAMAVGDRVAVMRAGRLMQIDTPQGVYDHPAHAFVATFFGAPTMNLLPGRWTAGAVVGSWGRVPAPTHGEGDVLAGFRPESVSLAPVDTGLGGRLRRVEHQGAVKLAAVDLDGHEVRLRVHRDKPLPAVGAAVWLAVAAADVHLFDADKGRRC